MTLIRHALPVHVAGTRSGSCTGTWSKAGARRHVKSMIGSSGKQRESTCHAAGSTSTHACNALSSTVTHYFTTKHDGWWSMPTWRSQTIQRFPWVDSVGSAKQHKGLSSRLQRHLRANATSLFNRKISRCESGTQKRAGSVASLASVSTIRLRWMCAIQRWKHRDEVAVVHLSPICCPGTRTAAGGGYLATSMLREVHSTSSHHCPACRDGHGT